MTTVSDCFDALRTRRVYRDSVDYDSIAAILHEGAGAQFHPVLMRNFLRILDSRRKPDVSCVLREGTPSGHVPSSQAHS